MMQAHPTCLLKLLNEHFHVRSAKMMQWSVYEYSETIMFGALSIYFPKLQPLAVYSGKKPILAACYTFLAYTTDTILSFVPDVECEPLDFVGQNENNLEV